ncbi:mannose-1-phosphate guanylyltransferase [Bacteroidia bacterium]|nr:mannose-1-phosphate guanylyltransferase [Bacteroidia bacterium]
MNKDRYCIIMAGGIGSRFWPISRRSVPKQFLDILGTGKTFIQMTYERLEEVIPTENFFVVTNASYRDLVLEQLPRLTSAQVLCEPIGRNTAPCIAFAAFHIAAINPRAEMIVAPSDHLVLDPGQFRHSVEEAFAFVHDHNILMTIGIKPSRPDTGFGYIQMGPHRQSDIYQVKTFTEKPDLEMARVFVDSGEFVWNAGIFLWKVRDIIDALERYLPDTWQLFKSIEPSFGTPDEQRQIDRIYCECRSISIDFGVMEKADNVHVRISDFGWSDIGTWGALYQYSDKDQQGNVASGDVMFYDTRNCIVKMPEGHLAVVEGLDDHIIVESDNVLMICKKEHEQTIKTFIDDVQYKTGEKFI